MRIRAKFLLVVTALTCCHQWALSQQQPFNTDPTQNYVSATMPRTPESAGFEKYGATQVNEFTGTTNVSIPIYTLKSRFLEAPITLGYQASGIRVNQEASWVGLGWDLNAGGRITHEVRGAPDFGEETFLSGTYLATNMKTIFNYYGTSGDNAILTPCSISTFDQMSDPNIPNWNAMAGMVQYGLGEPDIYRANFMGHSLTFYFDKTTITQITPDINPQIKFIGENSTFRVAYTLTNHNVSAFTITDNEGIQYLFNQTETTTNSYSTGSNPLPNVSTTSWLLTKVTHPSGDNIQFTYANYGYSVPAFTMSAAINWLSFPAAVLPLNPDLNTNASMQQPYYLTQMTTGDVTVNFNLGTRTDLYGPGSRQLNSITVLDNLTGLIKKTAAFNYSYFQSAIDANSRSYLTSTANVVIGLGSVSPTLNQTSYIQCSNTRLRLDSVTVNDGTFEPPYRFAYNPTSVDKYSLSQDHWGYYNATSNNTGGYSFSHLIPTTSFGVQTVQYTPFANALILNNKLGFSRESDPYGAQAMILTQIVYPTGGSTQFTYELHQSMMFPAVAVTGGGVRVKMIQNFAQGKLINTSNYTYSNGKYMGTIQYATEAAELSTVVVTSGSGGTDIFLKLSSNAAINFNDITIGYGQVTISQTGSNGTSNGSVVKTFNINTSTSAYAFGLGFNVVPPYIPPIEQSQCSMLPNYPTLTNWSTWLNPSQKGLPPTPSMLMEGKLMQEQYLDNSGNPLKSINYFYHQVNYTNNFYDIRAIQNRAGTFGTDPNPGNDKMNDGIGTCGNRPLILYISPAKSYHTLLDSVVETDMLNGAPLTSRKYYTYDTYYQTKTQQEFNSDGTSTSTTFTHVTDYLGNYGVYNSTMVQAMAGANDIAPVFTATTTRNGAPVSFVNNFYYMPTSDIFVPQSTQIQIAGNPLETREQYNQYDAYGHLMERQKPNGVKEDYLWGYDSQFPVASVLGSNDTVVTGLVTASILNAPASDAALRTELNKLRTNLPAALVTTYTYDNVYGVTSKTDPAGRTVYYNYDPIGRLSYIQDQDLNVIKRFAYNYAGQPTGSNLLVTTMLNGTLGGIMPYNITLTNTVTGQVSTYTLNPNTVPQFLANVVQDSYNITMAPEFTSSTNMQLTINGNTYTGTSFSLTNVSILSPTSFSLILAPGPCTITMSSGYTAVTDGITDNGTSVSFYMAFFSNATINPGTTYFVGSIAGSCIPSVARQMTTTSLGRNWTVTVSATGLVSWQMTSGTALSANTTVGGATLTYNL